MNSLRKLFERIFLSLSAYRDRNILTILCLGFSSGLPLALTASTLFAWLNDAKVSLTTIGLFASIGVPYTLKFLWSPLMDQTRFPILCRMFGRRRGWLLATQFALIGALILLGFSDPADNLQATYWLALLVAICSASQDIVIDAYRVELLPAEEQGAGAAAIVLGYRIGMIASGAGALSLSGHIGWLATYQLMAALIGIGIVATLLNKEPAQSLDAAIIYKGDIALWLKEAVIEPFADFMRREQWLTILLFILLYKLGDAFMGVMTNPFLLHIGFSKDDIAKVVKLYGVIATIIGSFIGGALVFRLGTWRSLFVCGIAHALTNLMFVAQAHVGANTGFLALSITLENISGGMGTAAFVAFISGLCHARFTATQYALLSSLSAFGRTWLSTPAGFFAEWLGWEGFFTLAAMLAIPGLIVLWFLSQPNGSTIPSPLEGEG